MNDVTPTRPGTRRSVLVALACVLGPTAVPYMVGPLTECGHCVASYSTYLPLVPGLWASAQLTGDPGSPAWFLTAGAIVLVALLVAFLVFRYASGRVAAGALATIALLSALQSIGFSVLLRA